MRRGQTAPDVTPSNDDGQLNPKLFHFGYLLGKFLDDLGRNVIPTAFFAKGLSTQF